MLVRPIPAVMLFALALVLAAPVPVRAANDTALRLANVSSSNTSYARIANSPDFSLQTFTLEAWVQRVGAGYGFTTDGAGAGILSKPSEGSVGSNIDSWYLGWNNSGQLIVEVTHALGSSGVYLSTPAVATPLARHHVAATFDGSVVRLYVDGVPSVSAPWSLGSVYYGANDVLIGADNFGSGYLRRFDGFIDDVRIWDHALTADKIASSMNCRLAGTEPGLVAYWPFDGLDLADATGHGHDGTPQATTGSLTFASLAPLNVCTAGVGDAPAQGASGLSMSVFPQPAAGRVSVDFTLPRPGLATVDVMDVAGRRVAVWGSRDYAAGPQQVTADVGALAARLPGSGVLFVRLRSGGQTAVRTLVVRR